MNATLTSCPLFSFLGGFAVALLLHPPKSDDKNGQEMFNWSELHSERSNFIQNPYFSNYTLFMVSPETTKRVEVLLQMQELSVSHK